MPGKNHDLSDVSRSPKFTPANDFQVTLRDEEMQDEYTVRLPCTISVAELKMQARALFDYDGDDDDGDLAADGGDPRISLLCPEDGDKVHPIGPPPPNPTAF